MENKVYDEAKYEKAANSFTDDRENFIYSETLRIFCQTNDLAIKLEALKLLATRI